MRGHLEYAVLGTGRWAGVMQGILARHSRCAVVTETRCREGELPGEYRARIARALSASGAQAAWICVPPSPETPLLAEAAVDSDMHVVAEKPWRWGTCDWLASKARAAGKLVAVHYEFCLLESVERWRSSYQGGAGLQFSGRFRTSKPDRLKLSALENLGSHLFAIHAYAAPEAAIRSIDCEYEQPDERQVTLQDEDRQIAVIDFTVNHEPIIERFIERFERAAQGENSCSFSLDFAGRVWNALLDFQHGRETNPSKL